MIRTIIVDDKILSRIGIQSLIDGKEEVTVCGTFGSAEEVTIRAIFSAKDVLPIPGRAAKRIRPGVFKPEIFSKMPSVFIEFLHD